MSPGANTDTCVTDEADHNTPLCLATDHQYNATPEQSVRDITNLLTERELQCFILLSKKH